MRISRKCFKSLSTLTIIINYSVTDKVHNRHVTVGNVASSELSLLTAKHCHQNALVPFSTDKQLMT